MRIPRDRLRAAILDGPLSRPAGAVYDLVVASEIAAYRVRGALGARDPSTLDDLTAIVKTFERPRVLRRLVASIRRCYPSLRTIVVDDSRAPTRLEGVETVVLPYDSGLSAGRREGLRRVTTRYVLVLDDDFVFTRLTRLGRAIDALERNPEIDLVGGAVLNLPFLRRFDYREGGLFPTEAVPRRRPGELIGGLPVYEKVANFFVARTERLRLVDWDPELKLAEHADFFTRARGVLTTVFDAQIECLHAQTPFDRAYMSRRADHTAALELLARRYGVPAQKPSDIEPNEQDCKEG